MFLFIYHVSLFFYVKKNARFSNLILFLKKRWDDWNKDICKLVETVDLAFLDATFFDEKELPGRDLSTIPHPLVSDSMERLASVAERIHFIHMNHSNALWKNPNLATFQGFFVSKQSEIFLI